MPSRSRQRKEAALMENASMFDGRPVITFDRETDRRHFLRWAGLVDVGASFVAGGGLGMGTASAATSSSSGDLGILNYALTLEYLEADFYHRGVGAHLLSGRELDLVTPIAAHEAAHVSAITAAIKAAGGTPVAKPTITYPSSTFSSRTKFLATASQFEELGVTAYHGQVPLIASGQVLNAAASIAGVESRHAAILADLTGGQPFPAPIEKHASKSTVLKAVAPFVK
jgi:hypothetical protein